MSDYIAEIVNSIQAVENIHYLELGTGDGRNFSNIRCRNKKSVDLNGNGTLTMSTDEYFALHGEDRFDVVFIDADHSYRQVVKDYNNAIKMCRLAVLIHDMYPKDDRFATHDHCGDSYKLLAQMIKSGTEVCTLDCDSGMTLVRMPGKAIHYSNEYDKLEYVDFVRITRDYRRLSLHEFKECFVAATSFDKMGTIKRYPYRIPEPIRMQTTDRRLLIFYICLYHPGYLKMMVLSICSILRNTDARKYCLRVYLWDRFKDQPEDKYLRKCGIEVVYISHFLPRYTVPFLKENEKFEACINMDCDAFALPNSTSLFSDFNRLSSPLSCGLILGDSMKQNLIVRKFQSSAYKDRTDEEFIGAINDFLSANGAGADVLCSSMWSYGFLCQYRAKLLVENTAWNNTYDFVLNGLKTSCDETSTMLFYHLSKGSILDITGLVPFAVGSPSYIAANGIVHPIVGHECNCFDKNIALIKSCVEVPYCDIPDPIIREWHMKRTRAVYPASE
jgi:hypothetical protein